MSEQHEKMVFIVTHAGEDPERATFPLLMANAALSMDIEAVVVLQGTCRYFWPRRAMLNTFTPPA